MATEIEIQKCTFDELLQNDEFKNAFFELKEILGKINPTCETIKELIMSPEIVAFFRSKNILQEFLEYFKKEALNFDPATRTFEEGFQMGLCIGQDFVMKKRVRKEVH